MPRVLGTKRATTTTLTLVLLLSLSRAARADERVDEAAAAYDRGAAAYERGEFAVAAKELARADELAPNPITLELALAAAQRTDDAILAMTLVERAEQRPGAKRVEAAADAVRRKHADRVGKLNVVCPVESPCTATLDGATFEPNRPTLVPVGPHRLAVTRAARTDEYGVTVLPGRAVELIPTAPRGEPSGATTVQAPPPGGLSPAWFWIGVAATALAGGATVLSALDTASKNDDFAADRSNVDASNAGRAAERRTVLLGVTSGVLAVATGVMGAFFVTWKHDAVSASATVGLRF